MLCKDRWEMHFDRGLSKQQESLVFEFHVQRFQPFSPRAVPLSHLFFLHRHDQVNMRHGKQSVERYW